MANWLLAESQIRSLPSLTYRLSEAGIPTQKRSLLRLGGSALQVGGSSSPGVRRRQLVAVQA